jgi:type IX secretion system PorP/SprF family membrane protein
MKRLIFFCCAILLATLLKAQQIGDYTNYFYKPMLYNPAFTGVQKNINTTAITRMQWTGFSNAPRFNAFTLDGKLSKKKIGLGLIIVSDKQGITGRTGGNALYSYSLGLSKYTRLSFGISFGIMNHSINFAKAEVENTTDPVLAGNSQSKTTIDGSVGLALTGKNIEAGFSIPQLLGNKIKYTAQSGTAYYQQPSQYLTYLRYKIFLNEEKKISLSPMTLIRYVPHAPFQFDGGLIFDWKKKFSIATIYKSNSAVAVSAGFWVYKHFNVAYSYDMALGNIARYSGQTHELLLSYTFGKEEEPEKEVEDSTKVPKMKDLNTLLLEKLLIEIDSIFENKNATKDDYRRLIENITQYSNSHYSNPSFKKMAKDYTKKLLELEKGSEKTKETTTAMVKGQIELVGSKEKSKSDFSDITIQLFDKETGALIGMYSPKPRNGKYILVLTPGEKYILKVEKEGYQTFSKDLTPLLKKTSYEIIQLVRLKKNKTTKTKQKK